MPQRELHIDGLKIAASQLIVLHHFVAYGPLSDALGVASPGLSAWLYDYGRMAVQAFLVLGGFLAARSLAAPPGTVSDLSLLVWQRYLRLAPAFAAAMLLAMGSRWLAHRWLIADFMPGAPSWGQFLAHVALLNGVLGVESLSAGVWYVAIDFQLFAVLALILWLGSDWAKAGVVLLMLASLYYFNRDADFDNWAVYFFGAYGLGAMAYWCSNSSRAAFYGVLLVSAVLAALAIDFRTRIGLALATALLLGLAQWRTRAQVETVAWRSPLSYVLEVLSNGSYALFLLHFSVLMLGNALFSRLGLASTGEALSFLFACWLASMGLALSFERWVARPLQHAGRLRSASVTV